MYYNDHHPHILFYYTIKRQSDKGPHNHRHATKVEKGQILFFKMKKR